MIKNEREYRITRTQATKFERALAEMETSLESDTDDWTVQVFVDAIRAQLADLQRDLAEYEALRSGDETNIEVKSLSDLPMVLIKARIANGMSQKDLAERVGLKEQQIQRYESHNYASANLGRIQEIAQALGIELPKTTVVIRQDDSLNKVFSRLEDVGISRDFAIRRFYPKKSIADGNTLSSVGILQMTGNVCKVFGWNPDIVFGADSLSMELAPTGTARFKMPAGVNAKHTTTYAIYSHYLAQVLAQLTADLPTAAIPTERTLFRNEVISRYGSFSFRNVLNYVWDLGIAVLPLNDPGAFHGACWRFTGRNIIVLKQRSKSSDRWLFDLLHEVWHAAQEPELDERSVIELEETSIERRNLKEEKEASFFAGDVILDGRAEELAQMCVKAANKSVERLKGVVPQIAKQENVSVGSLANYMAFRLALQGNSWWGAAQNLQPINDDPWGEARDVLLSRVDFNVLDEEDRELFLQAISASEV